MESIVIRTKDGRERKIMFADTMITMIAEGIDKLCSSCTYEQYDSLKCLKEDNKIGMSIRQIRCFEHQDRIHEGKSYTF